MRFTLRFDLLAVDSSEWLKLSVEDIEGYSTEGSKLTIYRAKMFTNNISGITKSGTVRWCETYFNTANITRVGR